MDDVDVGILYSVVEGIHNVPSIKGKLTIPEITELSKSIFTSIRRNKFLNEGILEGELVPNALNRYLQLCEKKRYTYNHEVEKYLSERITNKFYYKIKKRAKMEHIIVHFRGRELLIPKILVVGYNS